MPITLGGFVIPIPLMLQVCCQEFATAQDLTQIVDFHTHICDDHQPYLLDLFLCFNPNSCTVASHHPLGNPDHIVVSEHPYHRNIYSNSKVDWYGLRDHLWNVPSLVSFKHDATYAAKEITGWVEITIACYIPADSFS